MTIQMRKFVLPERNDPIWDALKLVSTGASHLNSPTKMLPGNHFKISFLNHAIAPETPNFLIKNEGIHYER